MADYVDNADIHDLLSRKHPYITDASEFQYSKEEQLVMLSLPRKEYLVTRTQTHSLYLILLTLLFSYAYDARSTQHDPSPESAWTISALTPAFSALDPPPYSVKIHTSTPDYDSGFSSTEIVIVMVSLYRRSIAFPLYRSFALAEACRSDVAGFLYKGRRTIVRCLLEMKQILDRHEAYYIYSKLWVEDFCVWTQAYASDDALKELAISLKNLKMEKCSLGWDLDNLEAAIHGARTTDSDSDDQ